MLPFTLRGISSLECGADISAGALFFGKWNAAGVSDMACPSEALAKVEIHAPMCFMGMSD